MPRRPAQALADMQRSAVRSRGRRPAACAGRRCASRRFCMRSEAWQSSVTVEVGTPPMPSSAVRRMTAQEPQKKVAFQRSLPIWIEAVEQQALVRHAAAAGEVPLERVGRVEMVRRLHHGEPRVAQQPAHGELQEGARRHVVAVEDGDVFAGGLGERVVDVAGLGALVIAGGSGSRRRRPRREFAELGRPAVVEDVRRSACRSASRAPARPARSAAPRRATRCRSG